MSPATSASVSAARPAHRATSSASGLPTHEACSDLAREMRRRWHAGERPPAESFFARDPQLASQPEAAVELIYEEFCLRDAAGDAAAADDVLRRFPQWDGPLRVMLECHRRVLQSQRERPRWPVAGEQLGEFRLTAEMARGARGRVFRAAQAALADRPVVLKVTPLDGGEHLSLARLQHTNIVPLYSVLDDPLRNVRVLCMPYFGRATLSSMFDVLGDVPLEMRSGADVVAAIDRLQDATDATAATPPASVARQMLASVSYVQAMCWITASLADALAFAHERGVLHLDLKPSNVLLATDGQPMLLDFHLARAPVQAGGATPDNIGGTPPYMPPEQDAAMRALQEARPVEQAVDARADVFALGSILHEALGGRLPVATDAPPLSQVNPHVSPGLSDVVARCLRPDPTDRYPDARSLVEDLRRHLTDQPLLGVANRSVRERWQKWRRRRPAALRIAAALIIATAAVAALTALGSLYAHDRREQAKVALSDGRAQLRDAERAADAIQSFGRGLSLLSGLPFQRDLRRQLEAELALAKRAQLAQQLHRLADDVRVAYGTDALPPVRARSLAAQCETLWQQRRAIAAMLEVTPTVRADLQDVAVFAAQLSAAPDAARLLTEAEADFGPTPLLGHERSRRGLASPNAPTTTPAPTTALEHYALGRALLSAGDVPRATEELSRAVGADPAGLWPNFYAGVCYQRMSRHEDAVAAFSVCIGGAPEVAGCYYNRALSYAALGRTDRALQDYGAALEMDPTHAAALLNRGMLRFQLEQPAAAVADLEAALKHGADAAAVHYNLAVIHGSLDDRSAALQHAERALRSNPAHARAAQLRDTLLQDRAPAKAGAVR